MFFVFYSSSCAKFVFFTNMLTLFAEKNFPSSELYTREKNQSLKYEKYWAGTFFS